MPSKSQQMFGFKKRDDKPRCIVQEDDFDDSTKCAKCGYADTFAYTCDKCEGVHCGGCIDYARHACKVWAAEAAAKEAESKARAPANVPAFQRCAADDCGAKLMVPMACHYCKVAYCSQHVMESDHNCEVWRAEKKQMRRTRIAVH